MTGELENFDKKYFYVRKGNLIKRSQYCKVKDCFKISSYGINRIDRCLDHRLKSMTNIRMKHVLCKIHDISHGKNTKCRKCRLNIDNYDYTTRYMKKKICENFYNELTLK